MKPIKLLYKTFSYSLEKAIEILSAGIMGAATLMIFVEVVTRSFGSTYSILEEGPRLFFCYAVMPMIGVIYKRNRHINVEFLPEMLKGKNKMVLLLFIDLIMIVASTIVLVSGISGTKALYQSGMRIVGVVDLPEVILMLSIPLGGGILLIYTIEKMVGNILSLLKADDESTDIV